ncbi:hypothetical protein P7C70_g741, partial [Phenoliferia sp. Uapishka_3]
MAADVASGRLPTTPAGGRHLKRLSLSLGSPSSPLAASSSRTPPVSALGAGAGSNPGTPTSRGHAPRHLRLSMSGGGIGYTRAESPVSAPPSSSFADAPLASSQPSSSSPTVADHPSPSPSANRRPLSAGPGSWSFPRASPGATASPRSTGHARRSSSISYSSSPQPDDPRSTPSTSTLLYASPAANSTSVHPSSSSRRGLFGVADSPQTHSPASSPTLDRFRSPAGNQFSNGLTGLMEEEDGEGEDSHDGEGSSSPTSTFQSSSRTGASVGAQPTLTELNSDLLNFIAKKERKCLDLREELKRHEEELKNLKKKWEAIVAKSLASSTPPTTTSLPRPSVAADAKRFSRNSSPSVSPHLSSSSKMGSVSSRPAPTHTLDLSLLSSTFDSNSYESDQSMTTGQDIDIEIGESVQAAKAWVGGVFGKLIDSVSGIEEQLQPSTTIVDEKDHRLDVLQEEDEDAEEGQTPKFKSSPEGHSSAASASSTEASRRDSTISTMSTDSSSSFFGSLATPNGRPRSSSSVSGGTGASSSSSSTLAGPTATRSSPSIFSLSMGFASLPSGEPVSSIPDRKEALSTSHAPPTRQRPAFEDGGHARRRSTFDVLGAAAGGGWKSLSGKWAAVQETETFKGTKRATLGFVDQFEKTLSETLGPLDPPTTPPPRNREQLLSTSPLLEPTTQFTSPVGTTQPSPSTTSTKASKSTSWNKAAPLSSAKRASSSATSTTPDEQPRTPGQQGHGTGEWDWGAFLDGVAPTPAAGATPSPHVGGYRRPSMTVSPTKPRSPTKPSTKTSLSILDEDSSPPNLSPVLHPLSPSVTLKPPTPKREVSKPEAVDESEWGLW